MKRVYKFLILLVVVAVGALTAQDIYNATVNTPNKAPSIVLSQSAINASYVDSVLTVNVRSNVQFTVTPQVDWISIVSVEKGNIKLHITENESDVARTGTVEVKGNNLTLTKTVSLTQAKGNPAASIKGDIKIKVAGGTASDAQPGEDISKSIDGDFTTMYHSSWGGGTLPVTLIYNFTNTSKIDYMIYHPRITGGSNGNFDKIEVSYKLTGQSDYTLFGTYSLGGSSSAFKIDFPEGLVKPTNIRVKVLTGTGGFASCAEMEFYVKNPGNEALFSLFTDNLCTALKPGVTEAQINAITNSFSRRLAREIFAGTYNTEFRVNEFEAFPVVSETAAWMRTSGYNQFENPTGIYFDQGEELIVFVENPGNEAVSLKIQNQVPGESGSSTYPLSNGINKIVAANKGQSYLNYYTSNWKTAPNVKVHFAFAQVTGYFDLEKYRTETGYDLVASAAAWKRILAGAISPMFDVISKHHHTCYPTAGFRKHFLNDGTNFALVYDSIVYREQEIMGLYKYNIAPKNRMYTRSVAQGMFADGLGAGIPNATSYSYMTVKDLDWWGVAHELGHVNQVRPAMKWVGTTEVTNNIYSAYVQHKIGAGAWTRKMGATAYYRLEYESHGGDDIRSGAGGRFNAYLNYGIKDGGKWLLTEGPDYYGSEPTGTPATRNYDHFVKLGPLWQLLLYFHEAGVRPDFYPQMFQMARTINTSGMNDGALQMNFMRSAIDSTGLNLTPFFEKVGMLRVYNNDYISDYSNAYMNITQAQIDALKTYAAKYPQLETPVLYYISINNWTIYRDKLPLEVDYKDDSTTNAKGVTVSGTNVTVKHNEKSSIGSNKYVRNPVAFETYSASGVLLRITMRGFKDTTSNSTVVLFPAGSDRIDAVGWDGTRKTIYKK